MTQTESDWLAEYFEKDRTRLRAVAYRMLGSLAEADDAVQDAWLRLSPASASSVDNLGAWLTTIVVRVCLNMLRSRTTRREEPIGLHPPDSGIIGMDGTNPEDEALLAEALGLALQVVLERLTPAERLALVLHDVFELSFDEIAPVVRRSPATARKLASRARRRVRETDVEATDPDLPRQQEAVCAYFAAARHGDLAALVAVLDPDVVLRSDGGTARPDAVVVRGAAAVARRALRFAHPSTVVRPSLVSGAACFVVIVGGNPFAVLGFTVSSGRIVEIDVIADPQRLQRLDLDALDN